MSRNGVSGPPQGGPQEGAPASSAAALPPSVAAVLPRVLAASDFVAGACARDPTLVPGLALAGELERALGAPGAYDARAPRLPVPAPGPDAAWEAALLQALRLWRRRELVRIAFRDLAGWATLEETLRELSDFADAAIRAAAAHGRAQLEARFGSPRGNAAGAQPLVILAMGKLGGCELNFSSDVDLVLLFPEHGETDGARSISNEEFFTRLGQTLGRLLEVSTADGHVLRVDLRLRPFGDSGPLVSSFAAFEDYLPRHGRDWERYAYVKARPVAGAERYAELNAAAVRPFVYRRYLDYGVFESLREMKLLIEREVQRRELADDVKLGPGGIREIEFIVQSLQLIRGGRDRRLQTPSIFAALEAIVAARLLSAEVAAELRAAYVFLRRLENRLQMLADRQEHRLPMDGPTQARIAAAMDAEDWVHCRAMLDGHRTRVARHFRMIVFGEGGRELTGPRIDLGRFWESPVEAVELAGSLGSVGFVDAAEAARLLLELRASSLVRRLDEPGRRRLQALLPPLLAVVGSVPAEHQLATLRRVLRIVEAIGQRSAYFALLAENTAARARLVELCAHGDFLAERMARTPLLLDELLDARLLSDLPERAALDQELRQQLEQLPEADPEQQVDALRDFQGAAVFRVAVADLTGRLPVMQVSDRLTEIAELIVESAIGLAWRQITAQFGVPLCGTGIQRRPVSVCAVGYGKLGGIELGYTSDLDLVFLHDSQGEQQETSGARPLDNQVFFLRLAQRIVHLLTVHSSAGRLYEVDVRLRPSGKGGLLVTNIEAFAAYQRSEAWTWEHQALLHARAVAGAPALRQTFETVRLDVLRHHVRRETLREDVRAMRERMRRELGGAGPGRFDLKRDAGGIGDVEFLAQYWALRWAREYPPVALYSDTIRQLESVASADLVPQRTVDVLTAAYRGYRTRQHHLALAGRAGDVPDDEFVAERAAVTAIWEAHMVVGV